MRVRISTTDSSLFRSTVDVTYLIPFAAGNFVYIAAAELVPEVNKHPSAAANAVHTGLFLLGAGLMYIAAALG